MAWMDSAAAVAGVRRAGTPAVVTAAVDGLTFRVVIRQGELVELVATVESVGRTSMKVQVEAHREDPVSHTRELCTEGTFTMVAVDEDGRPTPGRRSPPVAPRLRRVSVGHALRPSPASNGWPAR